MKDNQNYNISVSREELPIFPNVVWKVSWSPAGSFVYFSYGDAYISIWRECPDATWACVNIVDKESDLRSFRKN